MEKDLSVLKEGVKAGGMTFANTLKYAFRASSANFGNMAGASLFLPFMPFAHQFSFTILQSKSYLLFVVIVVLYLLCAELT